METRYPAGKQREKCHLRLIGSKAKGRGDPLLRPLGWLARTHLAGARPPAVVWSVGRVASTRAGERRSSGGHTNTRRFFCRTEAEEKKKERGRGDDKWRRKSEQVGGWLVRRRVLNSPWPPCRCAGVVVLGRQRERARFSHDSVLYHARPFPLRHLFLAF
jgi:hypothetical protein